MKLKRESEKSGLPTVKKKRREVGCPTKSERLCICLLPPHDDIYRQYIYKKCGALQSSCLPKPSG